MRLATSLLVVLALGIAAATWTAADEPTVSGRSHASVVVVRLVYAVAEELLPVLRELIEQQGGLPLRLAGDWRTNSVIGEGDEAVLATLQELVTALDVPVFLGHPPTPAQVIDLNRLDAVEAAAVLTRLIRSAPQLWRCTRRGPLPTVVAVASDNRLIVQGDPEARKLVAELVERVEAARDEAPPGAPAGDAMETAVIWLEHAEVDDIEPVLRELYPVGDKTSLRFSVDSHANTLHALGSPHLLDRLRRTVAHLDVLVCFRSLPHPPHVVELRRAKAVETAALLTHLIHSCPRRWQLRRHAPTATVVADPAGNRLIVQGDAFSTTRILDLVGLLDGTEESHDSDPAAAPEDTE